MQCPGGGNAVAEEQPDTYEDLLTCSYRGIQLETLHVLCDKGEWQIVDNENPDSSEANERSNSDVHVSEAPHVRTASLWLSTAMFLFHRSIFI